MMTPATVDELVEAVRATPRLLPVGAGTKPCLSAVVVPKLSTKHLSGIIEYEPDEFTFTALSGTAMRDIAAALAERGQYLPFDPMLAEAGATLGGTVAAGLSGPGRFRFGGVRDFILGVRFVDGRGRLLRMGGKVVKNAAGFDLPKFFVGSAGRFGVLAEMTFKVFPRPESERTIRLAAKTLPSAVQILTEAANSRYEFDALDIPPGDSAVLGRLRGPSSALVALEREVLARWPGEAVSADEAKTTWASLNEFRWVDPDATLVKIALSPATPTALAKALQSLHTTRIHISGGGNVAFVSLRDDTQVSALAACLDRLSLFGMTLRGEAPLWLGAHSRPAVLARVKHALDEPGRFPALDE